MSEGIQSTHRQPGMSTIKLVLYMCIYQAVSLVVRVQRYTKYAQTTRDVYYRTCIYTYQAVSLVVRVQRYTKYAQTTWDVYYNIELVYIHDIVYISGCVLGCTCPKVYKVHTDNLGCLLL